MSSVDNSKQRVDVYLATREVEHCPDHHILLVEDGVLVIDLIDYTDDKLGRLTVIKIRISRVTVKAPRFMRQKMSNHIMLCLFQASPFPNENPT